MTQTDYMRASLQWRGVQNTLLADMARNNAKVCGMSAEDIMRANAKADTRAMVERLTSQEQMELAIVPLIISNLAFEYAGKVAEYCRENRIAQYKRHTRLITELERVYTAELRKDLDAQHLNNLTAQANEFKEEVAGDLIKFFWSIKQDIDRKYPHMEHDILRSYALFSFLLCEFLFQHNARMDAMKVDWEALVRNEEDRQ